MQLSASCAFYFSVIVGSCYVVVSSCVFLCRYLQRGPQAVCGCGGDDVVRSARLNIPPVVAPANRRLSPQSLGKKLANSHPIPKHRSCTPPSPPSSSWRIEPGVWTGVILQLYFPFQEFANTQRADKYLSSLRERFSGLPGVRSLTQNFWSAHYFFKFLYLFLNFWA